MSSTAIHIALCFDNNYWALAYTLMRSVSIATGRKKDLDFHLLHTGLDPHHIADLEKIGEEFGARLHFYDLNTIDLFESIGRKGRYHKRLTHVIYARLMLNEILPETVKRVIYMDCDMYVRAPIEELAEMDLEGHAIAAVRDPYYFHIVGGRDLRAKRDLFDLSDSYFNSGLLVIDRDKWAGEGVLQKFAAMVADGTSERIYYDQDVLNLIFCRKWKRLDTLWNVVKPRGVHEPLDPKLLHYTGPRKPWHLVSAVAFAREYRHVMTNELFYRYMRFRMIRRFKRWLGLK